MGGFHRKALSDLGYEVTTVDPDPMRQAGYRHLRGAYPRHPRQEYDVACVAVPARQLVEVAYELAGVPRLLVEKPFATSEPEAAMLAAYLEASGSKVAVGFVERFNPRLRELRERIEGHEVTGARFTRWSDRPSWDVPLDLLIHDIDLARNLGLGLAHGDVPVSYDARAEQPRNVRRVEVDLRPRRSGEDHLALSNRMAWANLLDHGQSPLHALWHAFLTDHAHTPGAGAAVAAHHALGAYATAQALRADAVTP